MTSIITDPRGANRADCDLGVLTSLEALLGIIAACLPMAKPVASKCWKTLPSPARIKILTITSAVDSIVVRLSLPSLNHGSRSWDWFSSGSEEEYGQEKNLGGKSAGPEKGNKNEEGTICVVEAILM